VRCGEYWLCRRLISQRIGPISGRTPIIIIFCYCLGGWTDAGTKLAPPNDHEAGVTHFFLRQSAHGLEATRARRCAESEWNHSNRTQKPVSSYLLIVDKPARLSIPTRQPRTRSFVGLDSAVKI
jgi:hypothetical protein